MADVQQCHYEVDATQKCKPGFTVDEYLIHTHLKETDYPFNMSQKHLTIQGMMLFLDSKRCVMFVFFLREKVTAPQAALLSEKQKPAIKDF